MDQILKSFHKVKRFIPFLCVLLYPLNENLSVVNALMGDCFTADKLCASENKNVFETIIPSIHRR